MSEPLALHSPIWQNLNHAYGSAADIPDTLSRLKNEVSIFDDSSASPLIPGGALDELWSALCHQDNVYSASYAAIPHLVLIAQKRNFEDQSKILMLVGSIASAHNDPSSFLIPETENAYFHFREEALLIFLSNFKEKTDTKDMQYWLGTMAALKGNAALARLIYNLASALDDFFLETGRDLTDSSNKELFG